MLDQPLATSKMIAEKDGAIGRLIFNNPARHNAVSLEMWEAVTRIIDDFEQDDAVRVIVVSGAGGRAFVSGADISEFKEKRASEEAVAAYGKISEGARRRIQDTPKPTIAMISGYCIGGGVGTALACDLRIAAEGSRFGIPARTLGNLAVGGDRFLRGALLFEFGDIGAGDEGPAAGAAEDDDPDRIVVLEIVHDLGHGLPHLERHGIVAGRIVENQAADRPVLLRDHLGGRQRLIEHVSRSFPSEKGRC